MTLNLSIPEQINDIKPKITVIGIGGAGGNAVNTMINANVNNIEFITANTDGQALSRSLTPRQIQLGKNITSGLGAGSDFEIGRQAAEESLEEVIAETQSIVIPNELSNVIEKVSRYAADKYTLTLRNGQKWKVLEPTRKGYFKKDQTVSISKGLFGSYEVNIKK